MQFRRKGILNMAFIAHLTIETQSLTFRGFKTAVTMVLARFSSYVYAFELDELLMKIHQNDPKT